VLTFEVLRIAPDELEIPVSIVGEIEIMSGMVIRAEAVGLGGSVDWDEVERDAASSMPTCESYVSTLRAYAQANSGSGALVQDLNEFIRMYE